MHNSPVCRPRISDIRTSPRRRGKRRKCRKCRKISVMWPGLSARGLASQGEPGVPRFTASSLASELAAGCTFHTTRRVLAGTGARPPPRRPLPARPLLAWSSRGASLPRRRHLQQHSCPTRAVAAACISRARWRPPARRLALPRAPAGHSPAFDVAVSLGLI
jgi:hypothetical protein